MKDVIKTVNTRTFNHLRQGIALYEKNKVFYIKIQDLDTGVFTPIHNANKKIYKQLVNLYDKLDGMIDAQQSFDMEFGKRNLPNEEIEIDKVE